MQTTADKMIAALVAFNAGPNDDHAVSDLYNITNGFETLPERVRVVPSMFSVLERCAKQIWEVRVRWFIASSQSAINITCRNLSSPCVANQRI